MTGKAFFMIFKWPSIFRNYLVPESGPFKYAKCSTELISIRDHNQALWVSTSIESFLLVIMRIFSSCDCDFLKVTCNFKCELLNSKLQSWVGSIPRSEAARYYIKKGILKYFVNFTGKHLCQGLFFNKVAGRDQ